MGNAGHYLGNRPAAAPITSDQIPDGVIGTTDLADEAVTEGKIEASVLTKSRPQLGTAVATTSGTSIDFTSIPSWVERITVLFSGISLSGTADLLVQIGDGAIVSTGYVSESGKVGASTGISTSTSGFIVRSQIATDAVSGRMVLEKFESSANKWIESHTARASTSFAALGGGEKTLTGTLDRLRLTTTNGTDTFDAGKVNILYE